MTGHYNGPKRYEYLKGMSIEELEVLLTSDDLHPEDEEFYDAIEEEIVRRERENPTGRIKNVDEAWQEFLTVYRSSERELGASLFPDEDPELHTPIADTATSKSKKSRTWKKVFSPQRLTAAAILALSIATVLPPALGYESFAAMIGHWNDTVFHFVLPNQEPNAPFDTTDAYDSLEDAFTCNGVTTALAPKVPSDFAPVTIKVEKYPDFGRIDYNAFYMNGERNISIYIVQRDEPVQARSYEKDGTLVEVFTANNVEHYIYENNDRITITWYTGVFECSIQGDISTEEAINMIQSIYER